MKFGANFLNESWLRDSDFFFLESGRFSCPPMPLRAQRASAGTVALHRNGFQVHGVNVRSIQTEGKLKQFKKSLETEVISMNSTSPYTRPFGRFRMRWIDDTGKNHGLRWSDLTLTGQWKPL